METELLNKSSYSDLSEDQILYMERLREFKSENPYDLARLILDAIDIELYDVALHLSTRQAEQYGMEEDDSFVPLALLFDGLRESTVQHIRFL